MSDGHAPTPTAAMDKLMDSFRDIIAKSWVIPYGQGAALKEIEKGINAEVRQANDA